MTFSPDVYEQIREGAKRSAAVIVPLVYELVTPRTVVDVGCGEGWFAREFAGLGCDVVAVDEVCPAPGTVLYREGRVEFRRGDLLDGDAWACALHDRPFDLAVCLEVVEHLTAGAADASVATLCALAPIVLFSAAIPGQTGHGHVNCFPEGVTVSGPRARRSFARSYEGQLVQLVFASGDLLAATPNHPILTSKGWIAAGALREGDDVIRCLDGEGIASRIPSEYQSPALIQDVAAAIGITSCVVTEGVPITAEDFHGDGRDGEVAVVRSDSNLRRGDNPALLEPTAELDLSRRGVSLRPLVSECSLAAGLPGIPLSSPRSLRADDEGAVLSSRSGCGASLIRDRAIPHGYAKGREAPPYRRSADPENGCELLRSLAGLVTTDKIVKITVDPCYRGEVFNLETREGWFVADGVIVHNCQWPAYWCERFERHGFEVSGELRWRIWNDERVEPWYRQNLLVAADRRRVDPDVWNHLGNELFGPEAFDEPVAVVHPDIWAWLLPESAKL